MTQTHPDLIGYEAARTGAASWRVPDPGYLRFEGQDARDFIQRQTTNDIRNLTAGQVQLTILTSGTARILDVWRLMIDGDGIGAITLPGRAAGITRYLRKRIFFMDKVTVTDASAAIALFEIIGPDGAHLAQGWGDPAARLIPPVAGIGLGWLLMVPAERADSTAERLAAAGVVPLSAGAYPVLRIEAGLPGPERELTDEHTPLETNLGAGISGAKGCYTGQEVIARQVNYDKITRRLAGLRLDAPVEPGAVVMVEGRTAGDVTSAVISPDFGPIALAILRRPHHEPGTRVEAGGVRGWVVELPFRGRR